MRGHVRGVLREDRGSASLRQSCLQSLDASRLLKVLLLQKAEPRQFRSADGRATYLMYLTEPDRTEPLASFCCLSIAALWLFVR